ncbi:MAG: hypothetical protein Q7S57_06300 [bacterium]|nr:hypothetical protein [bacterium]
MFKIKNLLVTAPIAALSLVASSAMAGNGSWALVSFDQAQSGERAGTASYTAQQNANVSTATQLGNNAVAQSAATAGQSLTHSNGSFAQAQGGNVGSALTWNSVSGCGNPAPCSSGTGFSNVASDTIGSVAQSQHTNDATANLSENSSIAQFSKVGENQSAATGTLTQSNNFVVVPAPVIRRIDPAQSQTLTGKTHSEGTVFIPVTSIFTDISHFIQTITVTAQNILSF